MRNFALLGLYVLSSCSPWIEDPKHPVCKGTLAQCNWLKPLLDRCAVPEGSLYVTVVPDDGTHMYPVQEHITYVSPPNASPQMLFPVRVEMLLIYGRDEAFIKACDAVYNPKDLNND